MKKVILLAVPLLLAACAANINHNVAVLQGKTYLIETKNNNFFGFHQWSQPSTFKLLDPQELEQETGQKYVDEIAKGCKKEARVKSFSTTAPMEYDAEKFYGCVMEKLKK